ncbi:MAG: DEAD/DEAH box helicase [Planctomycetota bacterium]|nr:DEAD/DEAH box helicase [Planctomycetota bacterium]
MPESPMPRYRSSSPAASSGAKNKRPRAAKLSRLRRPQDLSLEAWQVALRKQFGREQNFRLKNMGREKFFSDFLVTNPASKMTYRVAIRGVGLGESFCSCPDYAVNTLGTCKHIEFALARLARKPGGAKALAYGFRPAYSEVFLKYGARREICFRPGLELPPGLRKAARDYFDGRGVLRAEAFARLESFLKTASRARHEVRCYDDALAFVAQVRDLASLKRRLAEEFPRGIDSPAFEKLLAVPLFPYQRTGALFAAGAGRALIADEMGLGKTIQALAAAEILARTAAIERVLVVCPTSLKFQWLQEIGKFTGREATLIEGLLPNRLRLYKKESFYKIVNYDVVHRDLDAIRAMEPDLIVLDEAQRIKNWKTRAAISVKRLASTYALVLTGTPLENRLEELHSIVEFVDRFRLGPAFRFLANHQKADEHGRVVGYTNLNAISETLRPILIRRTKQEVLSQLPPRLEKHYFVPMTPEQRAIHDENRDIVAKIVHKWRRCGFLTETDQRRLQIALQYMRMSCNSTYLCDRASDHGTKLAEVCAVLSELLERKEAKAVLFSQWLGTHELLAPRLKERGLDFVLFHGGVPGPKRKDLVQRFREESRCRVFLSTDAGGVGLNLQHASAVLNIDQPWNPAVLEQRIGRVHRLGQRGPVQVAHFVASGTIEHGMLDVLKFKKSLFSGVLDGGSSEVFMGGSRLKKFMDSVERVTGADSAMPPARVEEEQPRKDGRAEPAGTPAPAGTEQAARAMEDLAAAGKAFTALMEGLAGSAPGGIVDRDSRTGEPFIKLPLAAAAALKDLAGALLKLTSQT